MDKESSMVTWLKKQKKADLVSIAYQLHLEIQLMRKYSEVDE